MSVMELVELSNGEKVQVQVNPLTAEEFEKVWAEMGKKNIEKAITCYQYVLGVVSNLEADEYYGLEVNDIQKEAWSRELEYRKEKMMTAIEWDIRDNAFKVVECNYGNTKQEAD